MSNNVSLPIQKIAILTDEAQDPVELLCKYYAAVIPDWSNISKVIGFPQVSNNTAELILTYAVEKFPGSTFKMLWLNNGFGVGADVPDNCVKVSHLTYQYEQQINN